MTAPDGTGWPVLYAWGVADDGQTGISAFAVKTVKADECAYAPQECEALRGVQLQEPGFGRNPLVAASRNTMIVGAAGELFSWGWNQRGTNGHGHKGREPERLPRKVEALVTRRIVQAAVGGWHCLAVDERGQAYAWGGNEYGQCGILDNEIVSSPGSPFLDAARPASAGPAGAVAAQKERDILVPRHCLPPRIRVAEVSAGGMHSIVRTVSGEVWQWGQPVAGFFQSGRRGPHRVEGLAHIVRVVAGAFHNLALDVEERVLAWGLGDYGQLGVGHTDCAAEPLLVADLDGLGVVDISAGGWHSAAVTRDGDLYTWGRGEYGRLGLGPNCSSRLSPQPVEGLHEHVVVQASCGGSHTLALTTQGRVFAFGRGAFGRLGQGPIGMNAYGNPLEVTFPPALHQFKGGPGAPEPARIIAYAIAAGGRHSLAACVLLPARLHPPPAARGPGDHAPTAPGVPLLSSTEEDLMARFWWAQDARQSACPCGAHDGTGPPPPPPPFISASFIHRPTAPGVPQVAPRDATPPLALLPASPRPPPLPSGDAPGLGEASHVPASASAGSLPDLFRLRRGSADGPHGTHGSAAGGSDTPTAPPSDGGGETETEPGGGEAESQGSAVSLENDPGRRTRRALQRRATWHGNQEEKAKRALAAATLDPQPPALSELEQERVFEAMHDDE